MHEYNLKFTVEIIPSGRQLPVSYLTAPCNSSSLAVRARYLTANLPRIGWTVLGTLRNRWQNQLRPDF